MEYILAYTGIDSSPTYFLSHRIQWKFIAEQAPWWGGFWERLILSIRTTLRKILGNNCLTYEELYTILTQVEAMLNSRPITYTYSEPSEPRPSTPGHFLIGQRLTMLPYGSSVLNSTKQQSAEILRKRWRHREKLLDALWARWRREYLLELGSAPIRDCRSRPSVKLGDVVLLEERGTPRGRWRL